MCLLFINLCNIIKFRFIFINVIIYIDCLKFYKYNGLCFDFFYKIYLMYSFFFWLVKLYICNKML